MCEKSSIVDHNILAFYIIHFQDVSSKVVVYCFVKEFLPVTMSNPIYFLHMNGEL